MDEKIKLNYACFLNQSGYSQAARDIIVSLHNSGNYDLKLTVFGGKPSRAVISDEKYELFMPMTRKDTGPDRILIYHCIPTMQKREKKVKNSIGFATFETFQPPDKWIEILNKNDAIVVPSKFNYKIFAHAPIKKPLFHIPHSINTNLHNIGIKPLNIYNKFTFLFMGTWKKRKGYDQLLEAFYSEFSDKDNVQLIIKTDKPKQAEVYASNKKKQIGINKGIAPILFENKVFNEMMLPRFIKSAHCLISPHLGEGFGYPGLQSMALGVPVIITNFSGCQDYANEDTATLLEPNGFIFHKDMDGIPQFRSKKWAFVEVSSIRKSMRYVLNNPQKIREKAKNAYLYVIEKFNYKVIEDLFTKMIREIYG